MREYMRISFLLLALVVCLGCSKEADFKPVYDVPEALQPFIDRFLNEAEVRGFHYEIKNLIITYDESLGGAVCGQCNSIAMNASIQKIISINPKIECWFSDEGEEAFFFHELGHCFLGRDHDNSLLPNGDPKSLMVEDNLSLYAPCLYQIDEKDCNNVFKRPYYVDELFDEMTPVPDWGH